MYKLETVALKATIRTKSTVLHHCDKLRKQQQQTQQEHETLQALQSEGLIWRNVRLKLFEQLLIKSW